jgi:hypothetical protein
MAVFDTYAKRAVGVTDAIMGCQVSWVKDGVTYTGTGKYKDETGSAKLGDVKYGVDNWHIEITDSDFPGLKNMINKNGKPDITVRVRGIDTVFSGITADAVSDGLLTKIKLRVKVL